MLSREKVKDIKKALLVAYQSIESSKAHEDQVCRYTLLAMDKDAQKLLDIIDTMERRASGYNTPS